MAQPHALLILGSVYKDLTDRHFVKNHYVYYDFAYTMTEWFAVMSQYTTTL